ncbi:MAG TPA: uroporphyrinogen-III synthase [Gaiellaceae bacterium]|nr:uroporphyrinogen-III synthase [Gaiellaceae bacterium]
MRVLLTRPEGRNEELAERLRAGGHEVEIEPLIATEPLGDDAVELDGYDWLVVTSVTAARELRRRGQGRPRQVAAIGRATAAALGGADLVPAVSTQEGLLAELPRPAGRVLFAAAEGARRLLPDELEADVVALYRTRELAPATLPAADVVVLASASAARAYGRLGAGLPAVSIGPETTAAAERAGVDVVREANTHDLDGLVDALASGPW